MVYFCIQILILRGLITHVYTHTHIILRFSALLSSGFYQLDVYMYMYMYMYKYMYINKYMYVYMYVHSRTKGRSIMDPVFVDQLWFITG